MQQRDSISNINKIIQSFNGKIKEKNETQIVWFDEEINKNQNSSIIQNLKKINLPFQIHTQYQDAVNYIKNSPSSILVISSGANSKEFTEQIKDLKNVCGIIIYCGTAQYHREWASKFQLIQNIVDTGSNELFEKLQQLIHFHLSFSSLKQYLCLPENVSQPEYQHQNPEKQLNYLCIVQLGMKNNKIEKQMVIDELVKLKKPGEDINKIADVFKSNSEQEDSYLKQLVRIYTHDIVYKELNESLAKLEFYQIKNYIVSLYQQLKLNEKKYQCNVNQILYRGVSCIIDFQIGSSYYFNSLTSTSKLKNIAEDRFAKENGTVFEILLDEKNLHPHIDLTIDKTMSKFWDEEEVLLLPQFNFTVLKKDKCNNRTYYTIKQVEKDFSISLDQEKSFYFWNHFVENQIIPDFKIILEYNQKFQEEVLFQIPQIFEQKMEKQSIFTLQQIQIEATQLIQDRFNQLINEKISLLQKLLENQFNEKCLEDIKNAFNSFKNIQYSQNESTNLFNEIPNFLTNKLLIEKCKNIYQQWIAKQLLKNIIPLILDNMMMIILKIWHDNFDIKEQNVNIQKINSVITASLNNIDFQFSIPTQTVQIANEQQIKQAASMTYKDIDQKNLVNGRFKGYDKPDELAKLLASKPTNIREVVYTGKNPRLAGKKTYEIITQGDQRCLLGFNGQSKEFNVIRKIDQNGNTGYSDLWVPTGKEAKIGDITTSDLMKTKNQEVDVDNISRMNIKNCGQFMGGNIIGGAIGNVLANVDQYKSIEDFMLDAGKGAVFSGSVSGGLYMISQIPKFGAKSVPVIGYGLIGASSLYDTFKVCSSESLEACEQWMEVGKIALTTLAQIGMGMSGFAVGVELGVMMGAPTGPGAFIFGLAGGIIGGLGGGLIARGFARKLTLEPDDNSFQSDQTLPKEYYHCNNPPPLKWDMVPVNAKSFTIIVLQQDGDKQQAILIITNINATARKYNQNNQIGNVFRRYQGINIQFGKTIICQLIALKVDNIKNPMEAKDQICGCATLKCFVN